MTDYIEQLIDKLLAPPVVGPINHDVYQPKLTVTTPGPPCNYTPHCVYFYYVRFDHNGALRVDHYFYIDGPVDDPSEWKQIDYDDMPDIIAKLARNGRPDTYKDPPKLPQHNFENIVWKRRCYIAIFVDEANWKLHKRANGAGAIVFNTDKGSTPNSSFFDAADIEIDMSDTGDGSDMRSAIYFVNHLTCETGGSVGHEQNRSEYIFDVYFDVAFADPAAEPAKIVFDPGGTNQGPPQQP